MSEYADRWVSRIAYHEVGHALMALDLGQPVHRVWVRKKGGNVQGRTEFRPGNRDLKIDRADEDEIAILIKVAGPEAEAIYRDSERGMIARAFGGCMRKQVYGNEVVRRGDLAEAQAVADEAGMSGEDLEELKVQALRRVAANWRYVERAAETLAARGELLGNELRRLLHA